MIKKGIQIYLLLLSNIVLAQLSITKCDNVKLTPQSLISDHFLKSGINVLSIRHQSNNQFVGLLTDKNNLLGLDNECAVFATGNIDSIIGPNNRFGTSSSCKPVRKNYADETFVTGHVNYDAMVFIIEFIPTFDSICFEYCFGSEEYPEFVGSDFNDLFGLYLKPKGSKVAQNLAVLPNGQGVCINLVNHKKNKEYFIDNTAQYQFDKIAKLWRPYNQQLFDTYEYDGFTKALSAGVALEAGKVYELKIIICDLNDANFDSGVFLKSKSFKSIPSTKRAAATKYKKYTLQFDVASSSLKQFDIDAMQDLSSFITKNVVDSVFIIGHTDSTGTDETNALLSFNRADEVKKILIQQGVDNKIIRAKGEGSHRPLSSNTMESGREKNRRVEILLYYKNKPIK